MRDRKDSIGTAPSSVHHIIININDDHEKMDRNENNNENNRKNDSHISRDSLTLYTKIMNMFWHRHNRKDSIPSCQKFKSNAIRSVWHCVSSCIGVMIYAFLPYGPFLQSF
jgi:hypothetical protein